jgi:hypothetical protein
MSLRQDKKPALQTLRVLLGDDASGIVDLRQYPTDIRPVCSDDAHRQFSLPDLHGNVVLFVWILIKLGYVKLSKEKYDELVDLYLDHDPIVDLLKIFDVNASESDSSDAEIKQKSEAEIDEEFDALLTKYRASLEKFDNILESMEIVNLLLILALIGDETADRGRNDIFIARLIKKLIKSGLKIKIFFSNHGAEFLFAVKFKKLGLSQASLESTTETVQLPEDQFTRSLQNLGELVKLGLVDKDELTEFIDQFYIPNLYLIDAVRDKSKDESVTYFTHAPNIPTELEELHLKQLADYYQLPCDLQDRKSHPDVAKQINDKFREWLMTASEDDVLAVLKDDEHIINKTIWSRDIQLPLAKELERLFFNFGHHEVPPEITKENTNGTLVGTDGPTGKADLNKGVLAVSTTTFYSTPAGKIALFSTPVKDKASKPDAAESRRTKRMHNVLYKPAQPNFKE